MQYANSLDLDETSSNSASHPDPSSLTLRQFFTNVGRYGSRLNFEAVEKFSRQQFIWRANGFRYVNGLNVTDNSEFPANTRAFKAGTVVFSVAPSIDFGNESVN